MLRILLSMACKNDPNTGLQYAWASDRGNPIPLDHPCFNDIVDRLAAFDTLL